MSSSWDVYAEQLFRLGHGYPLWDPEPTKHGEVLIGDVGFINEGAFYRLFNATVAADDSLNRYGVPDGYEPFELGTDYARITRQSDLPAGPLCSQTIKCIDASAQVVVHGSGGGLSFQCTDEQGAVLITKEPIDRDALLPNRWMVKYMRQHYYSWYVFATEVQGLMLDKDDIIFVRGWAKTADWTAAAFMQQGRAAQLSFNGNFGFQANASLSVSVSEGASPILQQNSGPRERRGPVSVPSGKRHRTGSAHRVGPVRDQCVFLQYYKLKVRFGLWPTVLKAAAGPHNLPQQPDDGDDGPMLDIQSTASDDDDDCIESVPEQNKRYDPVDAALDAILAQSTAAIAIACDVDVDLFLADTGLHDFQIPYTVETDNDGVGTMMFESEVHSRRQGREPPRGPETTAPVVDDPYGKTRGSAEETTKGGCWSCRLRRVKCDGQSSTPGESCANCRRRHIKCIGWGPKRPASTRDKEAVSAYKAEMKENSASAGLLRGQARSARSVRHSSMLISSSTMSGSRVQSDNDEQ